MLAVFLAAALVLAALAPFGVTLLCLALLPAGAVAGTLPVLARFQRSRRLRLPAAPFLPVLSSRAPPLA